MGLGLDSPQGDRRLLRVEAPLRGDGSIVEREVASLEIRVRFPVAALQRMLSGLHRSQRKGRESESLRVHSGGP